MNGENRKSETDVAHDHRTSQKMSLKRMSRMMTHGDDEKNCKKIRSLLYAYRHN